MIFRKEDNYMYTCPYCQQDTVDNHKSDCLLRQSKPNYYHLSWLEIAVNNFKNNKDVVHTVEGDMTIKIFIKKWAKMELSKIVDI